MVSVDISVDPPSYGVALDGQDGVRETEAPRLKRRSPHEAAPQAAPAAKLLQPAGVASLHGTYPGPAVQPPQQQRECAGQRASASHAAAAQDGSDPDDDAFGSFAEAAPVMPPLSYGSPSANGNPANGVLQQREPFPAAAPPMLMGNGTRALPHPMRHAAAAAPWEAFASDMGSQGGSQQQAPSAGQPGAVRTASSGRAQDVHTGSAAAPGTQQAVPSHVQAPLPNLAPQTPDALSLAPRWGTHHGTIPSFSDEEYGAWSLAPADIQAALPQPEPVHVWGWAPEPQPPRLGPPLQPSGDDADSDFGDFEAAQASAAVALDRYASPSAHARVDC